jgi:hypothetical protein
MTPIHFIIVKIIAIVNVKSDEKLNIFWWIFAARGYDFQPHTIIWKGIFELMLIVITPGPDVTGHFFKLSSGIQKFFGPLRPSHR